MANLYGRLRGNRGETTRIAHESITTRLETWKGAVGVTLFKDGTYVVVAGSKDDPENVIAKGKINA